MSRLPRSLAAPLNPIGRPPGRGPRWPVVLACQALVAAGAASAEETLLQLRQRPPASVEQIRQLPPATDWRRSAQSLIRLQTVPEPVSPSISEIDASPPSRVAPGPASALTVTKEARRRPPATDRREPAPGIQLRMDWLLQALPADERVAHAEVDTAQAQRARRRWRTRCSAARRATPCQTWRSGSGKRHPHCWPAKTPIAGYGWRGHCTASRMTLPPPHGFSGCWPRGPSPCPRGRGFSTPGGGWGMWEEALAVAEPVVGLARARADLAVELALAARERGDWAQARAWLEGAQREGRHDEDVERLLAWTTLASGGSRRGGVPGSRLYCGAVLRMTSWRRGCWLALRGDLSKFRRVPSC
jgi:hypothetical protein